MPRDAKGEADIAKQFDRLTKMKEDSKMECVCRPMPSTGLYSRPAQMHNPVLTPCSPVQEKFKAVVAAVAQRLEAAERCVSCNPGFRLDVE